MTDERTNYGRTPATKSLRSRDLREKCPRHALESISLIDVPAVVRQEALNIDLLDLLSQISINRLIF